MRLRLVCIAASILAGATLPVSAQQTEITRAPDRGAHAQVPGIIVSPVPNLPFSGRDNIEWTRKLDDGSSLTQHLDAVVARDSQGRIYRETHSFVAAGSNQKSPLREFIIYDREARTRTACNVSSKRCEVSLYNPAVNRGEPPVGPLARRQKRAGPRKPGQQCGRKPQRGWHARNADHRRRRRRHTPAPGQHQGILVFARAADQRLGDPPVAHPRHPGDPTPRGLALRARPGSFPNPSRVPNPRSSLDARPQHRRPLNPATPASSPKRSARSASPPPPATCSGRRSPAVVADAVSVAVAVTSVHVVIPTDGPHLPDQGPLFDASPLNAFRFGTLHLPPPSPKKQTDCVPAPAVLYSRLKLFGPRTQPQPSAFETAH